MADTKVKKSIIKAANTALAGAADPGPTPGAVWSNNNKACNKTWWWLVFLNQIETAFPASGTTRMDALNYWNPTASPAERETEAEGLADMMIKGFTQIDGATYEPGHEYASAVLAMAKILTDAPKTIAEFAAVNDELFLFFNETKP